MSDLPKTDGKQSFSQFAVLRVADARPKLHELVAVALQLIAGTGISVSIVLLILIFVVGAPLLGIVPILIFIIGAPLLGVVLILIFVVGSPLLSIAPIFAIVAADCVPDEAAYDGAPDHTTDTTAAHCGAECTTSDSTHARIDCSVVPAIGSHHRFGKKANRQSGNGTKCRKCFQRMIHPGIPRDRTLVFDRPE
jgi:hypothetical protein